jgi:hypothetical protein
MTCLDVDCTLEGRQYTLDDYADYCPIHSMERFIQRRDAERESLLRVLFNKNIRYEMSGPYHRFFCEKGDFGSLAATREEAERDAFLMFQVAAKYYKYT